MSVRRVPAALFVVGALTGPPGAALMGMGARNQLEARKRVGAAEERYAERAALAERRLAATEERIAEFSRLQAKSYSDAVMRMVEFLRRHEKQVRESDRLLLDGVDVAVTPLPPPSAPAIDARAWTAGAFGSAAAAVGTAGVISQAVDRYGVASTGTQISRLSGAARDRAARAFLGGGSRASGGGGIARGNQARTAAVAGPALLVAGLVAKGEGTKALTHAKECEVESAIECAKLDVTDAHLRAVNQRVAEVSVLLTKLRTHAVEALDELESVSFEGDQHAARFQRAMALVKAVQDVAATPLTTADGSLTDKSETLTVKYRPMTAGEDDV